MFRRVYTAAAAATLFSLGVASAAAQDLNGAGSSFAYPLYSRWAALYARTTGVKVNYQSIGSSGGIRQLSDETVDFGASDGPMTDEQTRAAKGGAILHIPTVLGAVAITYNLTALPRPVRLTGDVLADIFLGAITKWNDPRLARLNPGLALPNQDIIVVHRSDGSGTTYIFTDYLTRVSPQWASGPGKAQTIAWPVGLGGKGSEGVTGQVKQTPGAIGYVELSYARQNHLPVALLQNAAGRWVAPTIEGVTAAAAGAVASLPKDTDFRLSIVNAPGAKAYPISSFTWILLYRNPRDSNKGRQLVAFVRWGLHEGQREAAGLDYAPLPSAMVKLLDEHLNQVNVAQR